uniref:Uncharacterized protein n=1 Tax=Avena sativa TaxID=4498 RepID=A0ACD5UXL8_AVESA
MTLRGVIQVGCEFFIVAAAGGSAFYFVKGALRSSSKGGRLAGSVQEVISNGPRVCRWAAWFGVMTAIKAGMVRSRQVQDPLNFAAAWGGANALFSVHRGPRAAAREGLKGAAYSAVTGFTVGGLIVVLLQPPESTCC